MKKIPNRLVFFGSGPVSAKSLKLLLEFCNIEAIITKPAARLAQNAVQDIAEESKIPVHVVTDKSTLDKLFTDKTFSSEAGIVIDFGIIISSDVIKHFKKGILNSHFSILPEWRGADPITFSILSGQSQTGVSLMLINEKMDEGTLLAQSTFKIPPGLTTPGLTDELIVLSNQLIKANLGDYLEDKLEPYPQDSSIKPSYSRKLTKEDGRIDWQKSATILDREIRAYEGWPGSYTDVGDRQIIITRAKVSSDDLNKTPGSLAAKDRHLLAQTGNGSLEILELKPAGKPAMSAESFIAGYRSLIEATN